ncbi:MAG: FtsX-like permease family protein [Bacteroidales bacterium]|nr:FtsX-like permease family protein [Bacteroidales bacterium]
MLDTEGKVLASTIPNAEVYENAVLAFVDSPADSQVLQGFQFFKVFDEHQLEYVLLARGDSDDVYMVGKLAAFQIQNLLVAYKERYDKDTKKVTVLIGMFGLVAIVIALMGVFGMVMFETQHRQREIAIRKVYGATSAEIIKMLVRRYAAIVCVCFVVAAPVAWLISTRWLEQFANKVSMPLWLYVAVLAVVLLLTTGIVVFRSWRAATENPAGVVKR